jgi:signal peptidase
MWSRAQQVIEAFVVLLAIVLLAGQAVGHPVLLGYVTTGSMEPTLDPGDGFVSLPPAVAGDLESGDVIVYRAEQVNSGGLTTHRIVRETDRGYITQGDANPFTDQSAGEPPVREPQIVAVGVQLGGSIVTIPGLGAVMTGLGEVASGAQNRIPSHIWIGAGVAAAFFLLATGGEGRNERTPVASRSGGHSRNKGSRVGPRSIIILCGIIVVATATASALAPFGPTEYRIVSADADLPGPRVIPAGESETTTYRIPGGSVFPTKYYLESASEGVEVIDGASGRIQPNAAANATLQLSAPPENGVYRRYVAENRYPLVLPEGVVDALYSIHPLAPVVALDLLLASPFVVAARLVGGKRQPQGTPGAATGVTWLRWFRR